MHHRLLQLLSDNARADKATPAIQADATGDIAHVYVYDVIDANWGASARALIDALAQAGAKPVHLHINSPGGDVFEARAMVSAVRAHITAQASTVHTYIDGLAASAATYLALAGQQVHIAEGGMYMVHNAWTLAWGNKNELRTTADLLDKIDATIAADYARKTSASADQITAWMDAETWFTAQEAKDAGFVDTIITAAATPAAAQQNAGRWNLSAYANAPQPPAPAAPCAQDIAAQADRIQRLNRSRLALLSAPL